MYKIVLIIAFAVSFAFGGNVNYLVYEINTDSTEINKYKISLESERPDFELIRELSSTTDYPLIYHPDLSDSVFPGQYYLSYQTPGDGGWIDLISNTNKPRKIIHISLDAMCIGMYIGCKVSGIKSMPVFSDQKANVNIKKNNILYNGIFDVLVNSDIARIDTLLYEETVKENAGKIKEMDVIKFGYYRSKSVVSYIILILLDYNIPLAVRKTESIKNVHQFNKNVGCYYNINGKMVGKNLSNIYKMSKGIYLGTATHSNFEQSTIVVR